MAIQFIPNQPLTWNSKEASWDDCKTTNDHACTLYSNDDILYAQWKQTECGAGVNKFCNPDFINSNPEKITNGNFTSGSTGWTLLNSTYDAVNKRINFNPLLNGSMIYPDTFNAGSVYIVKIETGGNTVGNLTVSLRGNTNYSTIYTPGTYTFLIQAGAGTNELRITGASLYNGWVDNVSVQLAGIDCTEFDIGPQDWQVIQPGSIKKIATYASNFYADFDAGSPIGGYYKITCKVSGMSTGSLTLADGGNVFLTITTNGIYEFFATIGSITGMGYIGVNFSASADFDGIISDLSAIQYSNYYQVYLESTDGGTDYYLSNDIDYYQEYLTLKKDLSLINPGCYELCIYDACGQNVNQQLLEDTSFLSPAKWSLNPGFGTAVVSGGNLTMTSAAVPLNVFVITSTTNYPLSYSTMVINWSFSTATWQAPADVYLQDKNGVNHLLCTASANSTYSGTLTLSNQNTLGIAIRLIISYTGGLVKTFQMTDLSLILDAYIPGKFNRYCSNCLEIKASDECLKLVAGTCNEDSFGFHFDPADPTYFQIGARVNAMLINPKYKGDIKSYNDSQGNNIVTKAKTDKEYTLFINYTDEHNHDWLRTSVLCDDIKIGGFISGYRHYINTDGDYQPEWPDNLGNWPSAQARVTVIEKDKTIYNNNAR